MWLLLVTTIFLTPSLGRLNSAHVRQDWWKGSAFYQIYVRSFMDSDGDGVGDLNGIISKLEYIKDLGADAIILSPIYKSPNIDFGYDVSDYYNIHHEYGTAEDFDLLVKKAAELSLKILLEFVPNHTSNESEWFIKSANRDEYYNDWYIWTSGHLERSGQRKPPNNWISVFRKSAWTYAASRDQFYLHQFGTSQPDLNYRNPVVIEEIKNIIKFWLEKGVAGMKLTSVNHIYEVETEMYGGYPDEPRTGVPGVERLNYEYLNHVYTRDINDIYYLMWHLREAFDSISVRDNMTRIMLTEASTSVKNAVRYYGKGTHPGAHVALNLELIEGLNKDSDARDIKYIIDKWLTYKPLKKLSAWMVGKNDVSRIASKFRPELVDAFNMLILLLPGISLTYMGEEIGMVNGFVPWTKTKDSIACNTDNPINFVEVSRDPFRTPFQWSTDKNAGFSTAETTWLPLADGYENLNVAKQIPALRSHFQLFRTLTRLRRRPGFKAGRLEAIVLNNEVLAFKRWYKDDTYIVVINFGKSYHVVNLTAFDLVFGTLEVEASSVLSSRATNENVQANMLDLAADEAVVLRVTA